MDVKKKDDEKKAETESSRRTTSVKLVNMRAADMGLGEGEGSRKRPMRRHGDNATTTSSEEEGGLERRKRKERTRRESDDATAIVGNRSASRIDRREAENCETVNIESKKAAKESEKSGKKEEYVSRKDTDGRGGRQVRNENEKIESTHVAGRQRTIEWVNDVDEASITASLIQIEIRGKKATYNKKINYIKIFKFFRKEQEKIESIRMIGRRLAEVRLKDRRNTKEIYDRYRNTEEENFRCTIPERNNQRWGVISDWDMSLAELHEDLVPGQNIVSLEKLTRSVRAINGFQRVETDKILVKFRGESLPTRVLILDGCVNLKVVPYVKAIKQCNRCMRFGHFKANCKSQHAKCFTCGDAVHGKCDKAAKCVNCGGRHSAMDRGCKTYQLEAAINRLMAYRNVSFIEARETARRELGMKNFGREDNNSEERDSMDLRGLGKEFPQLNKERIRKIPRWEDQPCELRSNVWEEKRKQWLDKEKEREEKREKQNIRIIEEFNRFSLPGGYTEEIEEPEGKKLTEEERNWKRRQLERKRNEFDKIKWERRRENRERKEEEEKKIEEIMKWIEGEEMGEKIINRIEAKKKESEWARKKEEKEGREEQDRMAETILDFNPAGVRRDTRNYSMETETARRRWEARISRGGRAGTSGYSNFRRSGGGRSSDEEADRGSDRKMPQPREDLQNEDWEGAAEVNVLEALKKIRESKESTSEGEYEVRKKILPKIIEVKEVKDLKEIKEIKEFKETKDYKSYDSLIAYKEEKKEENKVSEEGVKKERPSLSLSLNSKGKARMLERREQLGESQEIMQKSSEAGHQQEDRDQVVADTQISVAETTKEKKGAETTAAAEPEEEEEKEKEGILSDGESESFKSPETETGDETEGEGQAF